MKKLINNVDDVLAQALGGFGAAHPDLVRVHTGPTFVTRAAATRAGKVALISGGGSGHEPMHAGLVGLGMLDAACPGQVFTAPTSRLPPPRPSIAARVCCSSSSATKATS
jgi:dihydroxyacetone kinase-like protein